MNKKVILEQEVKTLDLLKDFQKATVERVAYLFEHNQNRVLVADEVGLGKTLIAKGVIAKTASIRLREGDNIFKTVYICSNQVIAKQNISKLNIFDVDTDFTSDTRLSMQHLVIWENNVKEQSGNNKFIQLIPLTPQTSFNLKSGNGTASERALIFSVLREIDKINATRLDTFFRHKVSDARWQWEKSRYMRRVRECNKNSNGKYLKDILSRIKKYDSQHHIIKELNNYLERNSRKSKGENDAGIITKLRQMFAEISVEMLEPDLIITDEFQRFKFMIQTEENSDSDMGILINKFFKNQNDSDDPKNRKRVLLLSATPYKLYSTLDEIEENNQEDEHYEEFFGVMNFLFDSTEKQNEFKTVWENYSSTLREMTTGNQAILVAKSKAENKMYDAVCRTERISVMDNADFIDDSSVEKSIDIFENDVLSYLQMGQLAIDTEQELSVPQDYAKSCPYLMSYMTNYKLKTNIEKYFVENPKNLELANQNLLWIDKNKINNYEPLTPTNARLETLKNYIFTDNSELFLWIPPSLPYYELSGVYKNAKNFSKLLIFSAWEMVPKMIGTMISYEAECRTVGELVNKSKANFTERKNTEYFADNSKRFPVPRLRFNISNDSVRGMSLFNLIYPSKTLCDLFNPIDCLNQKLSLAEIKNQIKEKLGVQIKKLEKYISNDVPDRDFRKWYYLAPMLLDGKNITLRWINSIREHLEESQNFADDDSDDFEISTKDLKDRNTMFKRHLDLLEKELSELKLGKMPDDLLDVLVDEVLGSFSVCLYRTFGDKVIATELARTFINRFNTPESTAIVMLAYNDFDASDKDDKDDAHWKNVLKYNRDGNFQAMIDEYYSLLCDGEKVGSVESKLNEKIFNRMKNALEFHTASYKVDTYNDFCGRIKKNSKKETNLRSHFAVAFAKSATDDSKNANRKESLRDSFNSPLRPFVLASTSVGQEGLDFHNYCRKIMHWNLPSNPVDLEQREGRINRFKCLALRQSLAELFKDKSDFKKNIWEELWQAADKQAKKENPKKSDLIPYWCLGKNQKIQIERIVPMYPASKDLPSYERLVKILSLYRLTLGQPRQEELLDYIFTEITDEEERAKLKNMFIDLSPFRKMS